MTDRNECIEQDAQDLWSQSSDRDLIRDYAHWQGSGRWKDERAWLTIGENTYAKFRRYCRLLSVDPEKRTMLEWGTGGGSNIVRFGQEWRTCFGVDISTASLEEVMRQCREREVPATFRPCLVPAKDPDHIKTLVDEPIDLFLSTAVFQHFPSQAYGYHVIVLAAQMLKKGGLAFIQIRYDDGHEKFKSRSEKYDVYAIRFTSYKIDEFWKVMHGFNIVPIAVDLDPNVNYATFFGRKA